MPWLISPTSVPFISSADPTNVALVGLCSGGYHAIESALAPNASTRSARSIPFSPFIDANIRRDASSRKKGRAAPFGKHGHAARPWARHSRDSMSRSV